MTVLVAAKGKILSLEALDMIGSVEAQGMTLY
jgi:hypothetical protein